MARVKLAAATDVPPGEGRVVDVAGRTLAVFNVEGAFFATDNACPHRGGPLGEGDIEGRVVACPWHGWRWDVTTGASVNNPAVTVACFPVAVEGDDLLVELELTRNPDGVPWVEHTPGARAWPGNPSPRRG